MAQKAAGIPWNRVSTGPGTLFDWQVVLKKLKEVDGSRTDLPQCMGMGVACVESHGTNFSARWRTVSVTRRGSVRVEKVISIVDAGT